MASPEGAQIVFACVAPQGRLVVALLACRDGACRIRGFLDFVPLDALIGLRDGAAS